MYASKFNSSLILFNKIKTYNFGKIICNLSNLNLNYESFEYNNAYNNDCNNDYKEKINSNHYYSKYSNIYKNNNNKNLVINDNSNKIIDINSYLIESKSTSNNSYLKNINVKKYEMHESHSAQPYLKLHDN